MGVGHGALSLGVAALVWGCAGVQIRGVFRWPGCGEPGARSAALRYVVYCRPGMADPKSPPVPPPGRADLAAVQATWVVDIVSSTLALGFMFTSGRQH